MSTRRLITTFLLTGLFCVLGLSAIFSSNNDKAFSLTTLKSTIVSWVKSLPIREVSTEKSLKTTIAYQLSESSKSSSNHEELKANSSAFMEDCFNGIDDDMDGLVDCQDPDCNPTLTSPGYRTIADGPWTSASTWLGGSIPPFNFGNEIKGRIISIEHHVTLNQTVIVWGSSYINIVNGSLTMTSGDLFIENADIVISNGELDMSPGGGIIDLDHNNGTIQIYNGSLATKDLITRRGITNYESACLTITGKYESNISEYFENVCATIESDFLNKSSSYLLIQDSEIKINSGKFENGFLGVVEGTNSKFYIPNGDFLNAGIWINTVTQYCVSGSVTVPTVFLPASENCATIQWYFDNCDCSCTPFTELCSSNTDEDGDGLFDCEDPDCGGTLDLGPDFNSCVGNTDTLWAVHSSPAPPETFVWSHGLGTDSFAVIMPTMTETYSVTMTTSSGCQISDDVTVSIGTCPEVCGDMIDNDGDGLTDCDDPDCGFTLSGSTVDPVCEGDTNGSIDLTVSGGDAPYAYNWSHGYSSEDPSSLGKGIYNVTVTDDNGCQAFGSYELFEGTRLTLNASITNATCFGDSSGSVFLTVTGGLEPYMYNWSTGETTSDIDSLGVGIYGVTITDAEGCTNNTFYTITNSVGFGLLNYFIPMPDNDIHTSLQVFTDASGRTIDNAVRSIISAVGTADGTVVYYDHWEDGYEPDPTSPVQSSTEIWGDMNPANGQPPGFASDIILSGDVITLQNDITIPRNASDTLYDGRDKLVANYQLALSRAAWSPDPGPVLAGAIDIPELNQLGKEYEMPIGEDIMINGIFDYVGIMVMAVEDATQVQIDIDGNGSVDVTTTLNQGESHYVDSGIQSSATVTANKPVMVNMITGDLGATFETRWFTMIPDRLWDDAYYAVVGTTVANDPARVYIYNPNLTPITINWTTQSSSGSFTIPSKGVNQNDMPLNTGAFYEAATPGQNFFGLSTIDSDSGSNSAHDWGYNLMPESYLTVAATIGWGPGSGDLSGNGSPVWVMANAPTTLYIDYDGDPSTGPLIDPAGNRYDVDTAIVAYQSLTVYDNNDNDQTGMRLYTLNGQSIGVAWGQDPATAGAGNPFLDMGTNVPPIRNLNAFKEYALTTDGNGNGIAEPGDVITFYLILRNDGSSNATDILLSDEVPTDVTYVANSTYFNQAAISDDGTGSTIFPLDEFGYYLPTIPLQSEDTISFQTQVNTMPPNFNSVYNSFTAIVDNPCFTLFGEVTVPTLPPSATTEDCSISFTDNLGTPVTNFIEDNQVCIELDDNDLNLSTLSIEFVNITVINSTNNDRETFALIETGVNTGIFRACKTSSSSSGLYVEDGTFYAKAGESISTSFTDPNYGEMCSDNAIIIGASEGKILYLSGDDCLEAVTAYDNFETGDFSGGTGWIENSWTELYESDGPNAGDVQVVIDGSTRSVYIDNIRGITRSVELSGVAEAYLSLDWRGAGMGGDEDLIVGISTDGVTYSYPYTINLSNQASYVNTGSIDLTPYIGDTTYIQLSTSLWHPDIDLLYLDNINITTSCADSLRHLNRIDPDSTSDLTLASTLPIGASLSADSVMTSTVSSGSTSDSTNLSFTHTTLSTEELLIVGVSMQMPSFGPSVSTITYKDVHLAKIGHVQDGGGLVRTELWQLINPPVGTYTVSINLANDPDTTVAGAINFTNVDLNDPSNGFYSTSGSGTSSSLSVPSQSTGIVMDAITWLDTAPTVGTSQTQQWNIQLGNANGAGSTEVGTGGNVNMSWTNTVDTNYAHAAVHVNAKPSISDSTVVFFQNPEMCEDLELIGGDNISVDVFASLESSRTERRVHKSEDDVEEAVSGCVFCDGPDNNAGCIFMTGVDIDLGGEAACGSLIGGLRWDSINVPQGATITNAYIQFDARQSNSSIADFVFKIENTDSTTSYALTTNNVTSRSYLNDSVTWIPSAWTANSLYQSPQLNSLVQQIVDRPGWKAYNAMSVMISGTGERNAQAFDNSPGTAPKLVILYADSLMTGGSPDVTATIKNNNSTIATLSNPTYNGASKQMSWSATLGSSSTINPGDTIKLEITNHDNTDIKILYDHKMYPSKITLPTNDVIEVDNIRFYKDSYPNTTESSSYNNGETVYIRPFISDPFGTYDITSIRIKIETTTQTYVDTLLDDSFVVEEVGCAKRYEFPWVSGVEQGEYQITVTGYEGYEDITDSHAELIEVSFNDFGTDCYVNFTDGDDQVYSYLPDSLICIEIVDIDENENATALENISVTIISSSLDTESVNLIETGINTGIFTACVPSSSSVVGSPNNGTVYAPILDILTAEYTDDDAGIDMCDASAVIATPAASVSLSNIRAVPADSFEVIGNSIRFDITVFNSGPTIIDTLSLKGYFDMTELSYASATIVPDVTVGDTLRWYQLGPMAPGESTLISVHFSGLSVSSPALFTAIVIGEDENTSPVAAGAISAEVWITNPELSVMKTIIDPPAGPYVQGDTMTFRIDILNSGSTIIDSLPLIDRYSAGCMTFLDASIPPDGSGAGLLTWNDLGALGVSGSTFLTTRFLLDGNCSPTNNIADATYAVDVNGDNVNGGLDTVTFDVRVPPIAEDDTDSTAMDVAVLIDVLANDTDFNSNLDATSVDTTGLIQPTSGSLSINPVSGAITYTPDAGTYGIDTFEYLVCDLTALCDTALVVVHVLIEDCNNGTDDDLDGLIDCFDPQCVNFTDAGTIGYDEQTCGAFDPLAIVQIIAPSGGSGGGVIYQWESSLDTGMMWSVIGGVTTSFYNADSIFAPTWYRRGVKRFNCAPWIYSNTVLKDSDYCPEICGSGEDEDMDGLIDCDDPDCQAFVTVSNDTSICALDTVILRAWATGGVEPHQFFWTGGSGENDTLLVTPSDTTTYYVNVQTATGCVTIDSVKVSMLSCPEVCTDGVDNDLDGLVDCDDPDCGLLKVDTSIVSACIDHPLMDIATLDVVYSWSTELNDTIEISIYGKTEYILPATGDSPDTVRFNIPADGAIGDTVIAKWRNIAICPDTSFYNSPIACSSDSLACNILYLCGNFKAIDAEAFDYGLITYIDSVNTSALIDAAVTKTSGSGLGLYDPASPSTEITVDFDLYDMIIMSPTTFNRVKTELIDTLKNMTKPILLMNHDLTDDFGMSTAAGDWNVGNDFVYTDDTNTEVVYNFNNIYATNTFRISHADYGPLAEPFLWATINTMSLDLDGANFKFERGEPLPGMSGSQGIRVYFGYHMDGVYQNAINNSSPVPEEGWFKPAQHLTTTGKQYLDAALLQAAVCPEFCPIAVMNPHILYNKRN